jgi:hypothetical protein
LFKAGVWGATLVTLSGSLHLPFAVLIGNSGRTLQRRIGHLLAAFAKRLVQYHLRVVAVDASVHHTQGRQAAAARGLTMRSSGPCGMKFLAKIMRCGPHGRLA